MDGCSLLVIIVIFDVSDPYNTTGQRPEPNVPSMTSDLISFDLYTFLSTMSIPFAPCISILIYLSVLQSLSLLLPHYVYEPTS